MAKKKATRKKAARPTRPIAANPQAEAGRVVDLDQLTLDPGNSCVHNERNLEVIAGSIQEVGAGRSVLMDADGIIRAGNGTVQGAGRAGLKKARIIETDGSELIVVKRTDLSGAKAVAAGVADNRASDLHSYDADKLKDQLAEIDAELPDLDLDGIGLAAGEIEGLLAGLEVDGNEAEPAEPEPDNPEGGEVADPYSPSRKRRDGIADLLRQLVAYYDRTEQCGHVKVVQLAYEGTDGIVVAHDTPHREFLNKQGFAKSRIVSLSSDKWLGTKAQPLLFDQVTLRELLSDAAHRISELEARLETVTTEPKLSK